MKRLIQAWCLILILLTAQCSLQLPAVATVTTTTNRQSATGDGSTTVFPYTFRMLTTSDMDVYKDGVLQGSGYTVSIDSDGVGGNVTFTTAPANGVALLFVRTADLTQETALPPEGNIPEETLENMNDKNTMLAQQLKEELDRKFGVAITTSGLSLTLPEASSLKLLRWNTGATALENVSANSALSDAGGNGGNVVGPSPATSSAKTLAVWADTGARTLEATISNGTSGYVLTSNGAGVVPSFQILPTIFGGFSSNARPLPTSGAISGDYYTLADWTSTGALTCTGPVRLYHTGTFTLNHNITCGTFYPGGITNSSVSVGGQNGAGLGGGTGGRFNSGATLGGGGGGGGGYAAGGAGGGAVGMGGRAVIAAENGFNGSGGGAGNFTTTAGFAGGAGAAGIYIEAKGNVVINADINCDGAAGSGGVGGANDGAGGGGAGGVVDIRTQGTLTFNAAKNITARGGAGGAITTAGYGGGGGGGGYVSLLSVGALTNSGTITVTGGALGSGATANGVAGSNGSSTATGSTSVVPRVSF